MSLIVDKVANNAIQTTDEGVDLKQLIVSHVFNSSHHFLNISSTYMHAL